MGKFITFGEIMFRFNPEGYLRLVQADKLEVSVAGGEANVAVSLANYGLDAAFVSKVPTHEVGDCVIRGLRTYGIDTKYVVRGGKRLGIYYVEKGASQRPSKVIYDREGSSIATAVPEDFDWDKIFEDAQWFHWTGITPALSDNLVQICLEACKKAKEKGITISCDLNYRKKLWSREKAGEVMAQLMPYVDVCIANEEDAADVFGIQQELCGLSVDFVQFAVDNGSTLLNGICSYGCCCCGQCADHRYCCEKCGESKNLFHFGFSFLKYFLLQKQHYVA